jgi:hypothetical protein
VRYDRAVRDNHRTFRRPLQLRLSVLYGLVQLYYGQVLETTATLEATTVLARHLADNHHQHQDQARRQTWAGRLGLESVGLNQINQTALFRANTSSQKTRDNHVCMYKPLGHTLSQQPPPGVCYDAMLKPRSDFTQIWEGLGLSKSLLCSIN